MPDPVPSPSAEFLDGVLASVRNALVALDHHDAAMHDQPPGSPARERTWAAALGRLEGNLDGWQGILGQMAEKVRAAQDDLAALDADLKRSLDAFAAARKHLQGEKVVNQRGTEAQRRQEGQF